MNDICDPVGVSPLKECSFCHWSNTDLRTIQVGNELKEICGGCIQAFANAVEVMAPVALWRRFDQIEARLQRLEATIIPP